MTLFHHTFRRGLVAMGAVAVLGGAAFGITVAQAQPATPAAGQQAQSGYQKFIDALAKRLNTSTAALETAIGQARTDAGLPAGGPGFPGGRGRGGPGGPGGKGFGADSNVVATALGITPQQLRSELPGKSLAQLAQAHNKPLTDVTKALKDAAHAHIDQAVTAGRLTADQANTMKAQIDQRIDQQVTQVVPQGNRGGRGVPGGPAGFAGRAFGAELNVAATALGITPEQLRSELPGKSLAQLAQAHNKPLTDVTKALKDAAHARIDQAVTAGRLTADQANTMRTQIDQRIDQQVNQVVPQRGSRTPGGEAGQTAG